MKIDKEFTEKLKWNEIIYDENIIRFNTQVMANQSSGEIKKSLSKSLISFFRY